MNIGIAGIDYFRLELRNPNSITYDTIRNKVHSEFWMTKTFGRIRSSIVFSFFSILSFRNNVLMNNTGWLTKCIDITQSRLELRNPNSITCDTIRNKVHSEFWMTKTLRTIRSSIVFLFFFCISCGPMIPKKTTTGKLFDRRLPLDPLDGASLIARIIRSSTM